MKTVNDSTGDEPRRIPAEALDAEGQLLGPEEIPLSALIDPEELLQFAESLAELTQMESAVMLYDPEKAVGVRPGAEIRTVRAPICLAIRDCEGCAGEDCRSDVHAAAHLAMEQNACVTAGCRIAEGLFYACPVALSRDGGVYPKAGIVAAAHDTYCFHFADRLAELTGMGVREVEELLCETDKRALNAAQLRRLRAIMTGQAASFSRQISNHYAELSSLAVVLAQRQELSDAYGHLDGEFRAVGKIQRALVPPGPPRIEGFEVACTYETARRAGGDYFDFAPLQDGSWGLLVVDASGHGPPAAVVMAMIHAIVHAYPAVVETAEQVMERLNGYLVSCGIEDSFATCFAGVLDPERGLLRCANAGHEAALLFSRAGGTVEEVAPASALPLGVQEENAVRPVEVGLNCGDVFLVYTDGIIETHNARDELFTKARLVETFQRSAPDGAEAVQRAVMEEVSRFSEGLPRSDDQTLVVIERLDPGR